MKKIEMIGRCEGHVWDISVDGVPLEHGSGVRIPDGHYIDPGATTEVLLDGEPVPAGVKVYRDGELFAVAKG